MDDSLFKTSNRLVERLLSVNAWELAGTKCQQAAAGPGEFKKLVYDSTFTKRAEEKSFVNAPLALSGATNYLMGPTF